MLHFGERRFQGSSTVTKPNQKRREQFFVEEAAKLSGKVWILEEDREHPDFIVTEGQERFGLEVREIFIGAQDQAGSVMKREESGIHRQIEKLRREYESVTPTTLRVQIVGRLTTDNMPTIVPALVAEEFAAKPKAIMWSSITAADFAYMSPNHSGPNGSVSITVWAG